MKRERERWGYWHGGETGDIGLEGRETESRVDLGERKVGTGLGEKQQRVVKERKRKGYWLGERKGKKWGGEGSKIAGMLPSYKFLLGLLHPLYTISNMWPPSEDS